MQNFKPSCQFLRARVREVVPGDLLRQLLQPGTHSPLLERQRAEMIILRVRRTAALFAILTPLWIIIDLLVFAWPVTVLLIAGRLITATAFGVLACSHRNCSQLADAHWALAMLFGIPTLFYLYAHPMLSYFLVDGAAVALSTGYAFLPFVMIAGLSVFPLTAIEAALFALPVLAAEAFIALVQLDTLRWSSHFGAFWLLLLIATVAALAGMSQLGFIIQLVRQASHDGLTGCFVRSSGEELLRRQFHIAARSGASLSVAFVDLDNFKAINDTFGHEAGDRVLRTAAGQLRSNLRAGDMLVRWGGEEFVILLPDTSGETAAMAMVRLRERGLGIRPDGAPITASMGIAERVSDQVTDWQHLVQIADHRMYQAKQAGKDRIVGCSESLKESASSQVAAGL